MVTTLNNKVQETIKDITDIMVTEEDRKIEALKKLAKWKKQINFNQYANPADRRNRFDRWTKKNYGMNGYEFDKWIKQAKKLESPAA